MKYNALTQ